MAIVCVLVVAGTDWRLSQQALARALVDSPFGIAPYVDVVGDAYKGH